LAKPTFFYKRVHTGLESQGNFNGSGKDREHFFLETVREIG